MEVSSVRLSNLSTATKLVKLELSPEWGFPFVLLTTYFPQVIAILLTGFAESSWTLLCSHVTSRS